MLPREEATSSVIALMIAGVVFMGAIGFVMFETKSSTTQVEDSLDDTLLRQRANDLSRFLVSSSGHESATGNADWTVAPDDLGRLGLLSGDGVALSYDKFDNLRRAPAKDSTGGDGFVNYPEARTSLGLEDEALDFHIRAFPNLKSVEEKLRTGYKDPFMKVTYIGDQVTGSGGGGSPGAGIVIDEPKCLASPDSNKVWRYSVRIKNGGTSITQFNTIIDVNTDGQGAAEVQGQTANSFLLNPDDTVTMWASAAKKSDITCTASTTMTVSLYDVNIKLVEQTFTPTLVSTPSSTATKSFYFTTGKTHYKLPSEEIVLDYEGEVAKNEVIKMTVRDAQTNAVMKYLSHTVPNAHKDQVIKFQASDLGAGRFIAYLEHVPSGVNVTQRLLVLESGQSVLPYAPPGGAPPVGWSAAVPAEVSYLESLVQQFCPYRYDSTTTSPMANPPTWAARCQIFKDGQAQPGDVFPDTKQVMNNQLPARLLDGSGNPRYDITTVLIVGSNVDHNSMTSGAAKHAVRDWVLGGGMLIVFGSAEQQVQWLQPIFHAGIQGSSGGIATPDENHPLLHTPDDLDYGAYDNRDKTWKLTAGADQHFTNVVEQGTSPITAISDPGEFGEGTVAITTWLPYDLYELGPGTTDLEALKLANNMLSIGYRTLYLDYGPPIPQGLPVSPATSKASINHPQLGTVTLDVVVFVFPTAP
jgi:hypothetical protein